MTVGIYARISLDRHDGEGVGRQLDDCRQLAAARGWDDLVEYVDNDISAFRARRRPEYERLLADLHDGRLAAVVAYHPDRLYRRPADLEAFIDAVQAAGADVATVKAGDVDLSTASGRMVARILGAVSRQESERIGERVSRAKRERAAQGRPSGGGRRPFGLTHDRTGIIDAEADALRSVAEAILAGATWGSQVERLNADGIRNTSGNEWTIGNLRRTLTSPHIAGLRAYHGTIVGPAAWPPVIDRGTWELLRADAQTRQRRGRPPAEPRLLTGLLACSHCQRTLWAARTRTGAIAYRCSPAATTTGKGCGRISISRLRADTYVTDEVGAWLQRPTFAAELAAWLTYGDESMAGAQAELDEIARQQVALEVRWAEGGIPDDAHDAAAQVLARRRTDAEARLVGVPRAPVPSVTAADLALAWAHLTVLERREAIRLVARLPIVVGPGRDSAGQVVPVVDRVRLRPVWE